MMKRLLVGCALLLSLSMSAKAVVVDSLQAPNNTWGLTWDGTNLWCGQDSTATSPAQLTRLDATDGTVLDSYTLPGQDLRGIAWDGTNLRVYSWRFGSQNVDQIYTIDPADGSIIDSVASPFSSNNYVGGMTWFDGHLWVTRYYPDDPTEIYELDPVTGESIGTIPSPHGQPLGITHDASTLWVVGDYFNDEDANLYQIDPSNGDVLQQMHPLGDDVTTTRPYDMAFDGAYFYLITKGSQYYERNLFKLQFGEPQPAIGMDGSPLDFGQVAVGDSVMFERVLRNTGGADLTWSAVFPDSFYGGPTEGTLVPGDSVVLQMTFKPAHYGVVADTLVVSSDAANISELNIVTSGEGVSPFDIHDNIWVFMVAGEGSGGVDEEGGCYVQNISSHALTPIVQELMIGDSIIAPDHYIPAFPSPMVPDELDTLKLNIDTATWDLLRQAGDGVEGHVLLSQEDYPALADTVDISVLVLDVPEHNAQFPNQCSLAAPYPNPFNAGTRISYTLPRSGAVTLEVVDLLGRRVALLEQGAQATGTHETYWNGCGRSGLRVSSGTYFIRMQAPGFHAVRRVQMVK